MAVKQYIGARYVPLLDGDYDANKAYEPLTTVNYGNATYTSKTKVPAGIVPTNTTYWMQTGFGNQQVSGLLDWKNATVDPFIANTGAALTEIDGELDTHSQNIAELQQAIDNIDTGALAGRKFFLLGDSLLGGLTSATTPISQYGALPYLCTNYPETFIRNENPIAGNSGFASSAKYIDQLRISGLTEQQRKEITDIVILGGTNDCSVLSSVKTAIGEFVAYCRENFPNAKISVGVIATNAIVEYPQLIETYKECEKYGCTYISDGENLLCNRAYLTDGTHLSDAGYQYYLPYLIDLIVSGRTRYTQGFSVPYTMAQDLPIETGTPAISVVVKQDSVRMAVDSLLKVQATSQSWWQDRRQLSVTPIQMPMLAKYKYQNVLFSNFEGFSIQNMKVDSGNVFIDSNDNVIALVSAPVYGYAESAIAYVVFTPLPLGIGVNN